MKLITLAIPVYNGEKCIGLTLDSINIALGTLIKEQKENIEIIISDNQSIDNTRTVVNKFCDTTDEMNIKYFCNENNVGYDSNIDLLVQRAEAKYVWFLGCGEKIKEDALMRLLQKLGNNVDYTNILVEFDIFDEKKNKITDKKVFFFSEDTLIKGKNNFQYNKYGLAVSSNIINREKWKQVAHHPLVVNGWCHVERILDMINLDNDAKTLLLQTPYFTLFRERDGWWTKPDSYLLFILHIKVIKSMMDRGYKKKIIAKLAYKQSRTALLYEIVKSKDFGLKANKRVFIDLLEVFKYDWFFWLFVCPILIIPNKLIFIPKLILQVLNFFIMILKYVKKNIF